MSGGHTPGPWEALKDNNRWTIFLPDSYLGNHIAYTSNGGVSEDQEEANARLIAAAPDLLEALEQARTTIAMLRRNVVTEIERHDGLFRWEGVPEVLQFRIDQCDAAIARASSPEGEGK